MKREEGKLTQARVTSAIINFRNRRSPIDYPGEVAAIGAIIQGTFGIELDPHDVVDFWEWYSEAFYFAGWLSNPSERDVAKGFPKWIAYMEGEPFEWDLG